MSRTSFPEQVVTRAPRGTKKSIRTIAKRQGALPAQVQRNALKKFIDEQENPAIATAEAKTA